MLDISLRGTHRDVFVVISCGSTQKYQTTIPHPKNQVQQNSRIKTVLNNGYFFDIPTKNFSISLKFYGIPLAPPKSIHKHLIHWDTNAQLIGEVSFQLLKHKFGKLTGSYGVTLHGKEIGKCRLGMGTWIIAPQIGRTHLSVRRPFPCEPTRR